MTSADLRDTLYRLQLTQLDIARLTKYSHGQINMMARGRSPVPEAIAIILRIMLEHDEIRDKLFPEKPKQLQEAGHGLQ